MAQFTATVVIPVWNQWQMTQACLESLRPTLGVHDTVIVVDNGSEDFTAAGLKQFPWVQVISNEVNQGFAIACNQGAAAATGDVVVFLNNDTLLPIQVARWSAVAIRRRVGICYRPPLEHGLRAANGRRRKLRNGLDVRTPPVGQAMA